MSLQANELRIGNFVRGRIGYDIMVDYGVILRCARGILGYEPIPIDEIWLVKLGFKLNNTFEDCDPIYELNGFYINYRSLQPEDSGFPICYYKVEYIHQLQNLYFAITGTELIFADKETKE